MIIWKRKKKHLLIVIKNLLENLNKFEKEFNIKISSLEMEVKLLAESRAKHAVKIKNLEEKLRHKSFRLLYYDFCSLIWPWIVKAVRCVTSKVLRDSFVELDEILVHHHLYLIKYSKFR